MIAVSYGEYDINCVDDSTLKKGLLCFWTLKNPTFPEFHITTEHSITCCAFASKRKNWIAIGDSHGNIAIYNVQKCVETGTAVPVAESKAADDKLTDKHNDIIWEVRWVKREGKEETLISISGDGRIIEWSLRKGIEM